MTSRAVVATVVRFSVIFVYLYESNIESVTLLSENSTEEEI
jgi:hypothetical protein